MSNAFEIWGTGLGITFGTLLGGLLNSGETVNVKLSPARELNLEGLGVDSEIGYTLMFFQRPVPGFLKRRFMLRLF